MPLPWCVGKLTVKNAPCWLSCRANEHVDLPVDAASRDEKQCAAAAAMACLTSHGQLKNRADDMCGNVI